MLRGVTVSTLVHASVLAMAVLTWPHQKTECEKMIERLEREEPGLAPIDILMRLPQCASAIDIPVDFVEIGLVTDIAAVQKAEDPEEIEEAVPEEAEQAPPPEEAAAPEEEEVVIPDETAPPEPKKKEEPKKQEPPKKKEEPKLIEKPTTKKDDLDFLNEFEDILKDKAQTERRQAPQEEPPRIDKPVLKDAQQTRQGAGERRGNTASLQAAMRRQIMVCWRGVSDLPPEDQIDVEMNVQLNRDGSLAGNVDLVSPRSRPVGRSGIAVDVALRAVRKCAPYQLPEDDYDQWKDITVSIGPNAR